MLDALGTEIQEGDIIFYGSSGRYADFAVCKIIKVLPKTVRAVKLKGIRHGCNRTMKPFIIFSGPHCVVINDINVQKAGVINACCT